MIDDAEDTALCHCRSLIAAEKISAISSDKELCHVLELETAQVPLLTFHGCVAMQIPIEGADQMRLPGFRIGQNILNYAKQIRRVVYNQTEHQNVTVVLGNPSCDLDSFVCSFVLSYFYNGRPNAAKYHKSPIYVPVLNLPDIDAKDLWRQRPEFGVALRGALDGLTPQSAPVDPASDEYTSRYHQRDMALLEQLITIHELSSARGILPSLRSAFQPSGGKHEMTPTSSSRQVRQDLILVDHNAPAIETIRDADIAARFDVVGVVDHHVEENYVPKSASPRIVQLGIGSCASLVVDHLRSLNLWTTLPENKSEVGYQQISRLALTPVLVDTWNLKAPGDRVSQLDRDCVTFLDAQTGKDFIRQDLFEQVSTSKAEALNLLRMQEIFSHDYKSYTERVESHDEALNVGIASVVKSMDWLVGHAKGYDKFLAELVKYVDSPEKPLTCFGILTRNEDRKEVFIIGMTPVGGQAVSGFYTAAQKELQLQPWKEDDALRAELTKLVEERGGAFEIWWMADTSKSRKQVAPYLRQSLRKCMKE